MGSRLEQQGSSGGEGGSRRVEVEVLAGADAAVCELESTSGDATNLLLLIWGYCCAWCSSSAALLLFADVVVAVAVAVSCAFVYAVGVPITHCARQQREGERERSAAGKTGASQSRQVRQARKEAGKEAAVPLPPLLCHISLWANNNNNKHSYNNNYNNNNDDSNNGNNNNCWNTRISAFIF